MGVSSVAIVSAEPSTDIEFTTPQAKKYYDLLVKHHQHDAHLMDAYFVNSDHYMIGGDSLAHARACKEVFQRQVQIVQPSLMLVMDMSTSSIRPYAGILTVVREFLADMNYAVRIERIYHYTNLGARGKRIKLNVEDWENQFTAALSRSRAGH